MHDKKEPAFDRVRCESFGGIVSCVDPPFLAWVDRNFMRGLGYTDSPLWSRADASPDRRRYLSAPTEVHWAVTNRCSQECRGCYKDSRPTSGPDQSTDELKRSLKLLRDLGVFHVALGGGEAFERDDFGAIVAYCRDIGLIPNVTTNGQSLRDDDIDICILMGQVNVSIDGIGEAYGVNGRAGTFVRAADAVRRLKKAGVSVGINCVVTRGSFACLDDVIGYAAEEGLNEVEFLKFKPSGRGRSCYAGNALTQEMIRAFYPTLMGIERPDSLELKIDCSFIPALLYHKPPCDDLDKCGVSGCDAGNVLLSVDSSGVFAGCSFIHNGDNEPVSEITERWHSSAHLSNFRQLVEKAAEPCRSCVYLSICRCGCRATALYHTGDLFAPDPECPTVFDYGLRTD